MSIICKNSTTLTENKINLKWVYKHFDKNITFESKFDHQALLCVFFPRKLCPNDLKTGKKIEMSFEEIDHKFFS